MSFFDTVSLNQKEDLFITWRYKGKKKKIKQHKLTNPFVKNAAENSGTSAVAGIEILRLGAWAQETLQDPLAPPQVLRPPRGASPV